MSRQCYGNVTVKVSLSMLCKFMIIFIYIVNIVSLSRLSRFSDGINKKKFSAATRVRVCV
jgi:hypothetical protein